MTVRTRQSYMDLCRSDRPWKGRDMADLVDKIYDVEEKADRASKVNATKLVQAKADGFDVAGEGFLQKREGKWILSDPDFLTEEEANKIYARIRHTHNEYALRRHAPTHHYWGSDPLEGQEIHGLRVVDRPTWAAVRLDPAATTPPTRRTGDIFWDSDNHCPSFVLEGSDTVWQGPMEDLLYGQNDSGVPHLNGTVGYIKGSQGQRPTIDISRADDRLKSLAVVFATEASIAANNPGYYTSRGFVRDVNTFGMAEGAPLWLQASGGYGTSKPSPGLNTRNVSLGHVVRAHATTGSVFADITAYPFVDELSGVSIVSPTAGQVLAFNGTIWENAAIGSGGAPIENHNDLSGRTVENCHNAMAITDFYALTPGQLTKRDGSGMVAAIPNTDYLAVNNPTYTGTLAGPRATLTEFGKFQSLVGDTAVAAIYGTGVTPSTTNYALRFNDSGTGAILNASTAVSLAIGATSKVYVTTDAVDLGSGVALKMSANTVVDSSRNITGASLKAASLAAATVRPATIGTDGLLGAQDPAAFLGTIGAAPSLHAHPYLPIANPEFTGTLAGPRATLTEFGKFQSLVGDTAVAAIYGTGVTPSTTNYALRFNDSGTGAILNASTAVSLAIGATSKVYVTTDAVDLGSGVALKMSANTVVDSSRNITGASLKAASLAAATVRPATIGTDGLLGAQDPAAFLGTIGAAPSLHAHPYLPIANPEFTGTLTGPTATLSGSAQEALRLRRSGAILGQVHGVDFQGQTDDLTWVNYARIQTRLASTANGAQTGNLRMLVYDAGASKIALDATPSWIHFGAGVGLTFDGVPVINSSRNITGATVKGLNAAGIGIRPAVALADGTFDDQDAAAFRGTIAALASANPNFTGILYQGGVQRIASDGTGWFQYLNSSALVGSTIRPLVVRADGLFVDQDAATFRSTISAAAAVHDHTSITGSAAKLTTARSIGMTGDGTWSVSFDGSANVSGAMTLASIIAAGGPVGSATKAPQFTWDSKGRLTAVDEVTIAPAWSSITSKPATFSGLGVTMLASDIPNHASRHHWDGADPLDGQSIAGLRTTSSPTFLDVTAGQFYATSNGLGQNYRVGDDLWIGDIDLANTCRIAGVQNPAIAYIKFGSAAGPTLGFSGTAFTLSSGIVLNGDLSFYNGAAVAYPGSGIGLRPASGIVRLVVDDTLVTANTAFLATSGQFANLVSGFVKSSSSGQLINGSILATDLPNHASRHQYGGADPLAGQSITGLRIVDSPKFLNLLLDGELRFTGYNVTSYDGAGFYVETSGSDQLLKMTVADGAIVGFGCHPDVQGRELGRAGQRWNVRSNDLNHDLETLTATNTTPGSSIFAIPSTGNGFILVNGASGSTRNYRVPNAPGSGVMKRIVLFSASIDPTGFTRIYPPSSGQLWNGGTQVTTYLEFGSSAGDLKIVMDSDGSNWYI